MSEAAYRIECIQTESGLAGLQGPWTRLMERVPEAGLFSTWEWLSTWWRHHNDDGDLWLLTARRGCDGELEGIAPLMLTRARVGPLAVRAIRFMFHRPVIHQGLIAPASEKEAIWAAIVNYLQGRASEWDVLIFEALAEDDALRPHLVSGFGSYRDRDPAINHVVNLPGEWDEYQMNSLSSNRRQQLRRARRKLEQEYPGQVVFERVGEPRAVGEALDLLIRLNRERWHEQGIQSSFDDPRLVAFHQEMAPLALEQGWLRFYQLRIGTRVAALRYNFRYGDTFYDYQLTFDPDWDAYRPGELLLAHVLQEAIREGARAFDFLRGTYRYKRSWSNETRREPHLLASNSWRGGIWLLGAGIADAAKSYGRERLSKSTRNRINRLLALTKQTR